MKIKKAIPDFSKSFGSFIISKAKNTFFESCRWGKYEKKVKKKEVEKTRNFGKKHEKKNRAQFARASPITQIIFGYPPNCPDNFGGKILSVLPYPGFFVEGPIAQINFFRE